MYSGSSQVASASAGQPGDRVLPVLPPLRDLFRGGGLQRGSVVALPGYGPHGDGPHGDGPHGDGPHGHGLLGLAIAAGASAAGAWCGVVGLPELGVRAAASIGLDPGRLMLVSDPGRCWPQVVAALLDGCDLVLVSSSARPAAHVRRHVEATLRRAGGVLVVAGDWPGAQARLWVAAQQWIGMGAGHGRLMGRRVQVLANGRGAAARPTQRWLWLPDPDGSVTPANPGIGGLAGPVRGGPVRAGPARAGPVPEMTVRAG
jgi:hypothetical protein